MKHYGPTLAVSKDLHQTKYRSDGESFEEAMTRVANALKDGDDHFREFRDILLEMRFMPGGRVQSAMGASRNVTGLNCLAPEVEILTKEHGSIAIEKVAGQDVTLLDGNGNWVLCHIYNHGLQEVYPLTFKGGFESIQIRSTLEHGWITPDCNYTVKTKAIKTKDLKKKEIGNLDPKDFIQWEGSSDYLNGVVHGLIYGDGSKSTDKEGYSYRVCSHQTDIETYLTEFPKSYPPSCEGDPLYYFYGKNAWASFKEFPDTNNLSYLLGFLRGWFAADGCVSTQPDATLCGGPEEYEWLKKYAPLVGWRILSATKLSKNTNFGKRKKESLNIHIKKSTLSTDDFLLSHHRQRWTKFKSKRGKNWRVFDINAKPELVNVYCPVVPTTHSFALACGIHSANCFVSGIIEDSLDSIMQKAHEAAETMRQGGGIGYDFSNLRPNGDRIVSLDSKASGPVSFMSIFDAICHTIASAGHRRGAQMGTLRIDHPDIEQFIRSKQNQDKLRAFNISVGVTDEFMLALESDGNFDLKFEGKVYKTIKAKALWEEIMRSTWDWAEPGVLFIDTAHKYNNLWYRPECELIATNPCVSGDTPILTSNGYMPINVLVGKEISIWNGEQWSTVKPFSTGYNETLTVNFSDGTSLRCTPYHKFILQQGWSRGGRQVRVEAKDLEVGDKLAKFSMPTIVNSPNVFDKNAYSQGFYAGDGLEGYEWSYVYEPKYVCLKALVGDKSPEEAHYKRVKWNHGPMSAKDIVPVYDEFSYKMSWLAGLLDSDGCIVSDEHGCGFQISSVNKKFLQDVRLMLTTLGVQAKVVEGHEEAWRLMPDGHGGLKEYLCKKGWRLLINHSDAYHLHLNGLQTFRLDQGGKAPQRDARRFVTVVSVEENEPCETFCFTDPIANRGTFNGIVTGNCGEIWLPEYGACLLGSFNLTKYIKKGRDDVLFFDINQFSKDIPPVVRAMDNIIDRTKYPLERQRQQMLNERRMGLGITGLANAAEILGMPYGSEDFLAWEDHILNTLKCEVYQASIELAAEKGSFPFFDRDRFLEGCYIKTLPESIRTGIYKHGLRNSHLLAIAPTGTISLCADNISSGIEPVFSHQYDRTIQTFDGPMVETVTDYAWREYKVKGRTADEVSAQEHLGVLVTAQKHIDNSVSKTCNVSPTMPWEEFKNIYVDAWKGGCKGVTTFNVGGKRFGILTKTTEIEEGAEACYIDPTTGQKSCG